MVYQILVDLWTTWRLNRVPEMREQLSLRNACTLDEFRDANSNRWRLEELAEVFPLREVEEIQKLS